MLPPKGKEKGAPKGVSIATVLHRVQDFKPESPQKTSSVRNLKDFTILGSQKNEKSGKQVLPLRR